MTTGASTYYKHVGSDAINNNVWPDANLKDADGNELYMFKFETPIGGAGASDEWVVSQPAETVDGESTPQHAAVETTNPEPPALNVENPVILDPERSENLPNGGSVYLRDGKTIVADFTGSTTEVDGDYVDTVVAVSTLFPTLSF